MKRAAIICAVAVACMGFATSAKADRYSRGHGGHYHRHGNHYDYYSGGHHGGHYGGSYYRPSYRSYYSRPSYHYRSHYSRPHYDHYDRGYGGYDDGCSPHSGLSFSFGF